MPILVVVKNEAHQIIALITTIHSHMANMATTIVMTPWIRVDLLNTPSILKITPISGKARVPMITQVILLMDHGSVGTDTEMVLGGSLQEEQCIA